MEFKTILVHVDGVEKSHSAMKWTIDLAHRFGAQVHGVYILPSMDSSIALISAGQGVEVVKQWRQEKRELGMECERNYNAMMQSAKIEWVWRMIEAQDDKIDKELVNYARCVDLSIVTQTAQHEDVLMAAELPEKLLLTSGRPVMIVPRGVPVSDEPIQNVVVAWDRSQNAARAVTDSIPILRHAKSVTAVSVNESVGNETEIEQCWHGLQGYLARHDIKVDLKAIADTKDDIGDSLMQYATHARADMIVAGGYGDSRLKEFLLGGVTRKLLSDCDIPIFLSH